MIDVVYCISLERLEDRRNRMINFLSKINFCPVYFFDAVDGSHYEWQDFYNEGVYEYKKWKLPKEKCNIGFENSFFWNRNITKGEMGCAVSHYSVWKHSVINGFNNVLIFEDDVSDDIDVLMNAISIFKDFVTRYKYDIFFLGTGYTQDILNITDNVIQISFAYCMHSYIISSKAIEVLLKTKYLESLIPCDEFLPAFFGNHPRDDIREMYASRKKMNAFRLTDSNMIIQQYQTGGSQTEIIK